MASSKVDNRFKCNICDRQILDPLKLVCLHSFCKKCMDSVPRESECTQGEQGWYCPCCKVFSPEVRVKQHHFLQDLIDIHATDPTIQASCKQCPNKAEANWWCVDCKMDLCMICKEGHLRIPMLKNHKIVAKDDTAEKTVDKLIFCTTHENELVAHNCKQCEKLLCNRCQSNEHSGHEVEPLETAIKRLLPEMKKHLQEMKGNQNTIKNQKKEISSKIEETKKAFSSCKKEICLQQSEAIKHVRTITKQIQDKLLDEESKCLRTLQEKKEELECKLKEMTNLTRLVTMVTTSARDASLLDELQGGLFKRVKEKSMTTQEPLTVKLSTPCFNAADSVGNVIGKVQVVKKQCLISSEVAKPGKSKDDKKPSKEESNINLNVGPSTMSHLHSGHRYTLDRLIHHPQKASCTVSAPEAMDFHTYEASEQKLKPDNSMDDISVINEPSIKLETVVKVEQDTPCTTSTPKTNSGKKRKNNSDIFDKSESKKVLFQ